VRILQVTELDTVHWTLARQRYPHGPIHEHLLADEARPLTLLRRWLPEATVETVFVGDPWGGASELSQISDATARLSPEVVVADLDLLPSIKALVARECALVGFYVGEPETMPALPIDLTICIAPGRMAASGRGLARTVVCPAALPIITPRGDIEPVDVVFAGPVGPETKKALPGLVALAKAPLGLRGEFSLRYHVESQMPEKLPVGITMHDGGPARGRGLIDTMAAAKIAIVSAEGRSDLNHLETLLVAAGSGAALVIERRRLARQMFTPDQDCLDYSDADSLVNAVYRLLENPGFRDEIAARGKARALADTAVERTWSDLDMALTAAITAKGLAGLR